MDSRLLFGLGIGLVSLCLRWRFPIVPSRMATFGVITGAGIAIWSLTKMPVALAGSLILNASLLGVLLEGWFSVRSPTVAEPVTLNSTATRDGRRLRLVDRGRDLVYGYTHQSKIESFREWLEQSSEYPAIRPHLSEDYLAKLTRPRTSYAKGEGAYEPLVQWFLDELDRLECEWNLR